MLHEAIKSVFPALSDATLSSLLVDPNNFHLGEGSFSFMLLAKEFTMSTQTKLS